MLPIHAVVRPAMSPIAVGMVPDREFPPMLMVPLWVWKSQPSSLGKVPDSRLLNISRSVNCGLSAKNCGGMVPERPRACIRNAVPPNVPSQSEVPCSVLLHRVPTARHGADVIRRSRRAAAQ
jgi:hypothetical protein